MYGRLGLILVVVGCAWSACVTLYCTPLPTFEQNVKCDECAKCASGNNSFCAATSPSSCGCVSRPPKGCKFALDANTSALQRTTFCHVIDSPSLPQPTVRRHGKSVLSIVVPRFFKEEEYQKFHLHKLSIYASFVKTNDTTLCKSRYHIEAEDKGSKCVFRVPLAMPGLEFKTDYAYYYDDGSELETELSTDMFGDASEVQIWIEVTNTQKIRIDRRGLRFNNIFFSPKLTQQLATAISALFHNTPNVAAEGAGIGNGSGILQTYRKKAAVTMKEMLGGCCVCGDENGWSGNPLVYCDGPGCEVAVHQGCYGIIEVPEGEWMCARCTAGVSNPANGTNGDENGIRRNGQLPTRCELCPVGYGALKRTHSGGWAHVICALYIPEVRFGDVHSMDPIMLNDVPHERFEKSCYLCEEDGHYNLAGIGACMQCNRIGCKKCFHVTCAQQRGLLCEEDAQSKNVKYCGFCDTHLKKAASDPTIKIVPAVRLRPLAHPVPAHPTPPISDPGVPSVSTNSASIPGTSPPQVVAGTVGAMMVDPFPRPSNTLHPPVPTLTNGNSEEAHLITNFSPPLTASSQSSIAHDTTPPLTTLLKIDGLAGQTPNLANMNHITALIKAANELTNHNRLPGMPNGTNGQQLDPRLEPPAAPVFAPAKGKRARDIKPEIEKPKRARNSSKSHKRGIDLPGPTPMEYSPDKPDEKPGPSNAQFPNNVFVAPMNPPSTSTAAQNGAIVPISQANIPTPVAGPSGIGRSGTTLPSSMEQLLERQWEQGTQFLLSQSQPFDVSQLLTCLHQLKSENLRLEEQMSGLSRRKEHLVALIARLNMPLVPIPSASSSSASSNGPKVEPRSPAGTSSHQPPLARTPQLQPSQHPPGPIVHHHHQHQHQQQHHQPQQHHLQMPSGPQHPEIRQPQLPPELKQLAPPPQPLPPHPTQQQQQHHPIQHHNHPTPPATTHPKPQLHSIPQVHPSQQPPPPSQSLSQPMQAVAPLSATMASPHHSPHIPSGSHNLPTGDESIAQLRNLANSTMNILPQTPLSALNRPTSLVRPQQEMPSSSAMAFVTPSSSAAAHSFLQQHQGNPAQQAAAMAANLQALQNFRPNVSMPSFMASASPQIASSPAPGLQSEQTAQLINQANAVAQAAANQQISSDRLMGLLQPQQQQGQFIGQPFLTQILLQNAAQSQHQQHQQQAQQQQSQRQQQQQQLFNHNSATASIIAQLMLSQQGGQAPTLHPPHSK